MLNGLLAFGGRIYYNEENKNKSGAMNAGRVYRTNIAAAQKLLEEERTLEE